MPPARSAFEVVCRSYEFMLLFPIVCSQNAFDLSTKTGDDLRYQVRAVTSVTVRALPSTFTSSSPFRDDVLHLMACFVPELLERMAVRHKELGELLVSHN